MNYPNPIRTTFNLLGLLLIGLLLSSCGSGGGDRAGIGNQITYTAAGTLSGDTQQGVLLTLTSTSNADQPLVAITDKNGNYVLEKIVSGSYTLTPSKNGFTFNPASTAIKVGKANLTGNNFSAITSQATTYTLSGTMTGIVKHDVLISLGGTSSATTYTNTEGNFSFAGLVNGNYTATPTLAGYRFSPSSNPGTINGVNAKFNNFDSSPSDAPTYNITGGVSGATLQGVTINLSGPDTQSATTDANGNYSFIKLINGNYKVTPVKEGYAFNPSTAVASISGASVSGPYFVASPSGGPSYSLTGKITGAVVENVLITLSGAGNATTTSNASGSYSFPNLTDGTYTVTPSLSGYTFSPGSLQSTISNANATIASFTATAVSSTYTISGKVSGDTVAEVTINLTGTVTKSTTTDANGNYSFTDLANGNYIVSPSKSGYTFNPGNTAVSVSGANASGANFSAKVYVPPTHTLSGTVTGDVIQNVLITLSGTSTGSTTTNSSGNYSFSGLADGTYTATPSLNGYSFNPTFSSVSLSGVNTTFSNFVSKLVPTPTYTISGSVSGATQSGVTINLTGSATKTTTTDTGGNYSFTGLANGNYTVTPVKASFTFSPSNAAVSINNLDSNGPFFSATLYQPPTFTLSGTVTGAVKQGVLITLSGAGSGSTNTNASGNYSFSGLIDGSTYTATPSLNGYEFSPTSGTVKINGMNGNFNNFVSAATLSSVTLTPTSASIAVLGTKQLKATGVMSDGSAYPGLFTWASTCNPAGAATISTTGVVTGKSQGTCSVTASSSGKTSNTATLTVTPGQLLGGGVQGTPLNLSAVVTTLAGATAGYVDGAGTAALFNTPAGVTTDGSNLYVADYVNHKIRQIVISSGVVTTIAGGTTSGFANGVGTAALFNQPAGVITDGSNLYVADSGNHKIRKIVIATGVVTTLAGGATSGFADGTGTAASFNFPIGITTDGSNLYVADSGNNNIRKIVIATGEVTTLAGGGVGVATDGTGTAATFSTPIGIATDGSSLYVADYNNHKIRQVVIATGVVTTLAGGATSGSADGTGIMALFNFPIAMTTDGTSLYVADQYNHKIRKIVIASGVVTTLSGGGAGVATDGTGLAASFNQPSGITSDGSNLYVSDQLNHRIRKIE